MKNPPRIGRVIILIATLAAVGTSPRGGDGNTSAASCSIGGDRTLESTVVEEYSYVYTGGKLMQMVAKTTTTPVDGTATTTTETLNFSYDASGVPMAVNYGGTDYYYVTNIQGDVMAILNTSGSAVVEYTYDAWGNLHSTTGTLAETLGEVNPLTYRGYVYDRESDYYYLQSRYYDPEVGRFINADALATTGQGLLGNNMFAYCNNNPVILRDSTGTSAVMLFLGATALGAVLGGLGALIGGGSADDIMQGAFWGAVEGATIFVWPESVVLFAGYNGFSTMVDAVNSGANMGLSVTAGIVAGTATFGLPGTGDDYLDMAVDLTFGAAESIMSDGVGKAIEDSGEDITPQGPPRVFLGTDCSITGKPIWRKSIIW